MSREPDEEFMSITEASVLVLEECPSSQWFEDEARLPPPPPREGAGWVLNYEF